ncbi:hypothetical protein KM043_004964 [Ampulex compressa]|nr:hypothetical protein KM043_004964 [Ampulex compressa]
MKEKKNRGTAPAAARSRPVDPPKPASPDRAYLSPGPPGIQLIAKRRCALLDRYKGAPVEKERAAGPRELGAKHGRASSLTVANAIKPITEITADHLGQLPVMDTWPVATHTAILAERADATNTPDPVPRFLPNLLLPPLSALLFLPSFPEPPPPPPPPLGGYASSARLSALEFIVVSFRPFAELLATMVREEGGMRRPESMPPPGFN